MVKELSIRPIRIFDFPNSLDLFRNRFEESAKRSVSRFLAVSSLQNQRSLQLEESRHMANLQPSMYGPPQKRN